MKAGKNKAQEEPGAGSGNSKISQQENESEQRLSPESLAKLSKYKRTHDE
jgi:hypothetical protein